jgi:hypothetical protein
MEYFEDEYGTYDMAPDKEKWARALHAFQNGYMARLCQEAADNIEKERLHGENDE